MRTLLTADVLRRLPPGPCDLRDTKVPGFVLRVRASGHASYLAAIGRGCWHTIGSVDVLALADAREQARGLLGDAAKHRANGRDPIQERQKIKVAKHTVSFEAYLKEHYEPWALEHLKRGSETVQRLRTVFASFLPVKLTAITPWMVEKWRTERLKIVHGRRRPKPETVNSHITMLKATLAKAVTWKLLVAAPLADVKLIKTDKTGRIRFLSPEEEQRLRTALSNREAAREARRERANTWRRERGYAEFPVENPDHLRPIVLLALNTGLRKGEIFQLRWSDLDLVRAQLTVRGDGAKSQQTRYVPLNVEAVTVLKAWQDAGAADDYVFPGREAGEPLDDVKKAWLPIVKAATLPAFTFHDLRHTFASKLVMAGVDLNTVRELLGHADIKMTLRYAHLAAEHKAAAVAKLVANGA